MPDVEKDALTFDETEALHAALIRHGDFQEDCEGHMEFDCRQEVYDVVARIVHQRMAQAWDEGHDECCAVYVRHCATAENPYGEEASGA